MTKTQCPSCMRIWEDYFEIIIFRKSLCCKCLREQASFQAGKDRSIRDIIFVGEDDKGLTFQGILNTHGKWVGLIDAQGVAHAVLTRTVKERL